MRRLIINADDFGLTPGVNRAIVEAHRQGVVTSATLMAGGRSFADAVAQSAAAPRLAIGCHVALVDESPLSPPAQVRSFLRSPGTSFHDTFGGFAARVLTRRVSPAEVESEATAQIRTLISAGVSVSHFDTHKHTHILPGILVPLLRAARACGVRAVRNPFPPVRSFAGRVLLSRPGLWKRRLQMKLLRGFAPAFHRLVREHGFATTDGVIGLEATGILDERLFSAMLEALPQGTWELVSHPGYNDSGLQSIRTRLRESRALELEILTSPASRALLDRLGIELISFRDLVPPRLP